MARPSIADHSREPDPSSEPDHSSEAARPPVASAAQTPTPAIPDRGRSVARFIAAVSGLAALVWITGAALSAGHGFDTSDEGYYLLSYRWWDVNHRTFTGSQYLYGPVFEALGWNIAGLRLFRLLTVIVTVGVFGWTFMRWLRTRRPNATPSRWWEAAGTLTILAAGGTVYGWLPLSPGYNDVALLSSMLCMAVVLRTATATELGRKVPFWVPLAAGPLIFVMMLVKWSSSIFVIAVAGITALVVLWPRGWREILRFIGLVVVGLVVGAVLTNLLLVPLTEAIPQMLEINRLAAAKTNSPAKLLLMYARTTPKMAGIAARTHIVVLLALIVAVVARGKVVGWIAAVLAAAGVAVSVVMMIASGGLTGGTLSLRRYPSTLTVLVLALAVVVVTLLLSRRSRRESSLGHARWREWFLLGILLTMPFLHAVGTGNAIYMMAVNGYAFWMALAIAVVTGIEGAPRTARLTMTAVTAMGVAAAVSIGFGGALLHPYRTQPYAETTRTATGVPALASIRLNPANAAKFADLHQRLQPYLRPGRAIMGFDEMAGVVLALDGRPVGEAWYSASDRKRTAAGIIETCRSDKWFGSEAPVLVFRRPVSEVEVNALRSCGLDIDSDYRRLAPPEQTYGLTVYVPEGEHS